MLGRLDPGNNEAALSGGPNAPDGYRNFITKASLVQARVDLKTTRRLLL